MFKKHHLRFFFCLFPFFSFLPFYPFFLPQLISSFKRGKNSLYCSRIPTLQNIMSQPSEADISVVLPVATLLPRYVPGDTVQKTESVVHITITQVGTVVYTHTATSYSYVPTYSTVSQVDSSNNPTSIPSSNNTSGDEVNMNAIIGGAVGGGFALIALVGEKNGFIKKYKCILI
jgi:hypothetical protein